MLKPKSFKFNTSFLVLLFALYFIISCDSKDEIVPPTDKTTSKNIDSDEDDISKKEIDLEDPTYEISDFVWRGMNRYYYWQNDVLLLDDTQLSNLSEYKKLIQENSNPENFFNKMIYKKNMIDGDRFSWFIHDYEEQERTFSGISKSHGMDFDIARYSENSNRLYGYVRVVHLNSNATNQGVKRGMFFTHINGEQISADNVSILFDSNSYELTFSEPIFDDTNSFIGFNTNGTIIELTKEENFKQNPILVHKVIQMPNHKIGYLYFHSFLGDSQRLIELNDVFGQFKSEEINELVVDLRYNRGGYSFWSDVMATAISGEGSESIISKTFFNQKIQDELYNGGPAEEYFPQFIEETPINKLDIERVFFLTTSNTASASEAVINNLEPYMDVQIIGHYTVGKNEGSITILDVIEENKINPRHKNGIQPLILKSGNSEGFINYEKGLEPDFILKETPFNLLEFGNIKEPLLNKAIEIITGIKNKSRMTPHDDTKYFKFDIQHDQQNLLIYPYDVISSDGKCYDYNK